MNEAVLNGEVRAKGGSKLLQIGVLFFLLLVNMVLYTFAHEGGHALVGLLFGGRINDFSINFLDLSAHVGIDGDFALWQRALISVAGVSTPVILGLALLILTAKKDEIVLYIFKTIFFFMTVNSLLAWVIIPILAMTGQPVGDDSFNFLNYTRIPPLVESGAALLVYGLYWITFFQLAGGVRGWVSRLRGMSFDPALPETRKSILSIGALGAVALAAALALAYAFPAHGFSAPAGYEQVAELDLSQGESSEQSVYRFQLEAPARVGFAIYMNDVQGAPVKVVLSGPGGNEKVFLNMSDPKTQIGRASVTPPIETMEAGEYEIVVSFPKCEGKVKVYFRKDEG